MLCSRIFLALSATGCTLATNLDDIKTADQDELGADDQPNQGAECIDDNDCTGGAICPQAIEAEETSYCYMDCSEGLASCKGSGAPLCTPVDPTDLEGQKICLEPAQAEGQFSCPLNSEIENGSRVSLYLGVEKNQFNLRQCWISGNLDGGQLGIATMALRTSVQVAPLITREVFLYPREGVAIPASRTSPMPLPLRELAVNGVIFDVALDKDWNETSRKVVGFFFGSDCKIENLDVRLTDRMISGNLECPSGRMYSAEVPEGWLPVPDAVVSEGGSEGSSFGQEI